MIEKMLPKIIEVLSKRPDLLKMVLLTIAKQFKVHAAKTQNEIDDAAADIILEFLQSF